MADSPLKLPIPVPSSLFLWFDYRFSTWGVGWGAEQGEGRVPPRQPTADPQVERKNFHRRGPFYTRPKWRRARPVMNSITITLTEPLPIRPPPAAHRKGGQPRHRTPFLSLFPLRRRRRRRRALPPSYLHMRYENMREGARASFPSPFSGRRFVARETVCAHWAEKYQVMRGCSSAPPPKPLCCMREAFF